MTSGHVWVADILFLGGFGLLGIKMWPRDKLQKAQAKVALPVCLVFLVLAIGGNRFLNRSIPLSLSPSEIVVDSKEWHSTEVVTISNVENRPRYSAFLFIKPSDANVEFNVVPISGPGSDVGDIGLDLEDDSIMWPIIRIAPHGYVLFKINCRLKQDGNTSGIALSVKEGSQEPESRTKRIYK